MNVDVSTHGVSTASRGESLSFLFVLESFMNLVVSSQGAATALRGVPLGVFCVLFIFGHGCVIPRGSYVSKGVIPCILSLFDSFMGVGVSTQEEATDIRG